MTEAIKKGKLYYMTHCEKCGENIDELSAKGKFLRRTNKYGDSFRGECAPYCEFSEGDCMSAVVAAVMDNDTQDGSHNI